MLTCSSLVAPQVVKHYCSQWWHFVKMTAFPFKCTAVSGYRIALNPKLRWSLSLKIFKDRAHLLAFKFFILEKFSCFIVLLFFFCYFPIIRTDSCVISWKITFFLNFISCHIFAIYVGGACLRLPATCRLIVLLHKSQCALRYLDPMSISRTPSANALWPRDWPLRPISRIMIGQRQRRFKEDWRFISTMIWQWHRGDIKLMKQKAVNRNWLYVLETSFE